MSVVSYSLMKFRVEIEETLSRIVEVDAETADDAEREVRRRYRAGEIVLGGDDCTEWETREWREETRAV